MKNSKKIFNNPAKKDVLKPIVTEVIFDPKINVKQNKNEIEEEKIIKAIRNLFRLKREDNAIEDKVLREIRILFKSDEDEDDYYKPVRTNNAFSGKYIKIKSNDDKSKCLSVKEYLNKTRAS